MGHDEDESGRALDGFYEVREGDDVGGEFDAGEAVRVGDRRVVGEQKIKEKRKKEGK